MGPGLLMFFVFWFHAEAAANWVFEAALLEANEVEIFFFVQCWFVAFKIAWLWWGFHLMVYIDMSIWGKCFIFEFKFNIIVIVEWSATWKWKYVRLRSSQWGGYARRLIRILKRSASISRRSPDCLFKNKKNAITTVIHSPWKKSNQSRASLLSSRAPNSIQKLKIETR